jgi:hypothetical protein
MRQRYLRLLERWVPASEQFLYAPPDRPDLTCYGSGYNTWGVQTNQKALAAYAVLAADPDMDEERVGMSRSDVADRSLRLLRFSLESHIAGSYHCMDSTSWGHTWISVLGIERMMHAVDGIADLLSESDRGLLRKVLESEANWIHDEHGIEAGLYGHEGRNKPESNIWNGALLHRVATMFPDTPRATEYRSKGDRFLANGISVPSDGDVEEANFFESFALNHHSYLNVGYMVICLSNVAMLHFFYKERHIEAPKVLYKHVLDLWELIKHCTFPDGRLLRIGGDTRARYCYCQDYLIPVLLLVADLTGDPDLARFEEGWLELVEREALHNGDGLFLSERCATMRDASPLYFTRLESDRAATLSMGAYWRRGVGSTERSAPRDTGTPDSSFLWQDEYHGACLHRTNNRIASWVWRSGELPQGLMLPADRSDMAEWRQNLAGLIRGTGNYHVNEVLCHDQHQFEGGFLTFGTVAVDSQQMIAEGQNQNETIAYQRTAFVALPDGATAIGFQHAKTGESRPYLRSVKGLLLNMPNDLFNGTFRTYHTVKESLRAEGCRAQKIVRELDSPWVNIDDCLSVIGVYGAPTITLHQPAGRQIGLRSSPEVDKSFAGGALYSDEICYFYREGTYPVDPLTSIYDIGFVMQVGLSHHQTRSYYDSGGCRRLRCSRPEVRVLRVLGQDDRWYVAAFNPVTEPVRFSVAIEDSAVYTDSATGTTEAIDNGELHGHLESGAVRLWVLG